MDMVLSCGSGSLTTIEIFRYAGSLTSIGYLTNVDSLMLDGALCLDGSLNGHGCALVG